MLHSNYGSPNLERLFVANNNNVMKDQIVRILARSAQPNQLTKLPAFKWYRDWYPKSTSWPSLPSLQVPNMPMFAY